MDADAYRRMQEEFVSGHAGSSSGEVAAHILLSAAWLASLRVARLLLRDASRRTMMVAPQPVGAGSIAVLVWLSRLSALGLHASPEELRGRGLAALLPALLFDWVLLAVPLLCSLTVLADALALLALLQASLLLGLIVLHRSLFGYWCVRSFSSGQAARRSDKDEARGDDSALLAALERSPKRFITVYRSWLMLGTALAILAVDFRVFPRRFCKTETFGFGLMDTGVGSFIVSHALTSVHARAGAAGASSSHRPAGAETCVVAQGLHVLRAVAPLVALGVLRLLTIKAVSYQEHVSEYGVHWNFFFTLAAVALLSVGLSRRVTPAMAAAGGVVLIAAYQLLLSHTSLTEWALHAPRVDLVSANKEGLLSSAGYAALYLCSVTIGSAILQRQPTVSAWWRRVALLSCADVALWLLTAFLSAEVQPPSRRLVNAAYAAWMLALNLALVVQCLLMDLLLREEPPARGFQIPSSHSDAKKDARPEVSAAASLPAADVGAGVLLEAINRNSLPFFLLCNLGTGAVNLLMRTLFVPDALAMAVVRTPACAAWLLLGLCGASQPLRVHSCCHTVSSQASPSCSPTGVAGACEFEILAEHRAPCASRSTVTRLATARCRLLAAARASLLMMKQSAPMFGRTAVDKSGIIDRLNRAMRARVRIPRPPSAAFIPPRTHRAWGLQERRATASCGHPPTQAGSLHASANSGVSRWGARRSGRRHACP